MPAAKQTPTRKSARPSATARASASTRARVEQNGRVVARVKDRLEAAQRDLAAIRGSVGTGGRDLRKDVAKLLRDARRDVEKMNRELLRDLKRLQRDLVSAPKAKAGQRTRGSRAS